MNSLQQSNNHAYTGSEGEPEDGPAVAASIYIAVMVYAVRHQSPLSRPKDTELANRIVLYRVSSFSAASKPGFTSKTAGAVPYHFAKLFNNPSISPTVS